MSPEVLEMVGLAVESSEYLSPRQKQIVYDVCLGATNREIGEKLGISPNTVDVQLTRVFIKTGLEKRTQLLPFLMSQFHEEY